ncbi:MAG TPA: FMN-binding protein [Candidatus Limnocylindrales bacterium]|jgi:uncharacterized protein with FMN-binding domain
MPKRGAIALTLTTAALLLLLTFKTPTQEDPALASGAGDTTPAIISPSATDPPASSEVATATEGPQATAHPQATSAPASAASGTVQGDAIQTRFGTVQVEVTVKNGKITNVTALQLPWDHQRSADISQYVEPILHDEAIQAQSANVDIVSGATYTSIGYARSLQSALDQLKG